MLAVTLPQAGDKFRILSPPVGVEPLLELVEDQEQLLTGAQGSSQPYGRQAID